MGANPSKRDKWPPPKSWRHVWMAGETQYAMPHQALVLDWRADSRGRWSALVTYVEEASQVGPRFVEAWVPAERLRPVFSDPNAFDWRSPRR